MAAAAETQEQYAHSLSTLRQLGHLSLVHSVEPPERAASQELAFSDFETAVAEMLKTDAEFRDRLDIERIAPHAIVGGTVVNDRGEAMVDVVRNGAKVARRLEETNPAYGAQAIRDECDIRIAGRADELKPGQTLIGLSMTPVEELEKYPEVYEMLGYKKELVYLQAYTKVDEHNLVALSFSVDAADENTWRDHLATFGINIPDGASTNTWLEHAEIFSRDAEEAKALVHEIRDGYYEKIGQTKARYSVSEYITAHRETIKQFFDTYYGELSVAAITHKNNDTLKAFATALLKTDTSKLKSEVRQQLIRMANANAITDDMIRAADSLVRYAATEELRKGLPDLVARQGATAGLSRSALIPTTAMDPAQIHEMMASNVQRGVQAGRSYSGCAGNIELSNQPGTLVDGTSLPLPEGSSPQEAYGGRESSEGVGKISVGLCVVPNCPTSPRKVLVGGCGVCLGRCQKLFDVGVDPTKMFTQQLLKLLKPVTEKTAEVIDVAERRVTKVEEQSEPHQEETPEKAPALAAVA